MEYLILLIGMSDLAMVGLINRIASTLTPEPGLTQNDTLIKYCKANNINGQTYDSENDIYFCSHRVELDLGRVYEFVLFSESMKLNDQSNYKDYFVIIILNFFFFYYF